MSNGSCSLLTSLVSAFITNRKIIQIDKRYLFIYLFNIHVPIIGNFIEFQNRRKNVHRFILQFNFTEMVFRLQKSGKHSILSSYKSWCYVPSLYLDMVDRYIIH